MRKVKKDTITPVNWVNLYHTIIFTSESSRVKVRVNQKYIDHISLQRIYQKNCNLLPYIKSGIHEH